MSLSNAARLFELLLDADDALEPIGLFDHDGRCHLELCGADKVEVLEYDDDAWGAWIGRLERAQARCSNATDESAMGMAISLLNDWREPMWALMRAGGTEFHRGRRLRQA